MKKLKDKLKLLNLPKCIDCADEIAYYNTNISATNKVTGKSALTTKSTGHTLKVCEPCLIKRFPDFETKNKGRVFNQMNPITKYAFQIEDAVYEKKRDSFIKNTVDTFKEKFGDSWEERWNQYCNRQSYSNSFEYKAEKHGMDEIEYKKFNKSRAVTLKNMIAKYGDVEGTIKFNEYKQKQVTTKSFEYMVQKFGYDTAITINKSKGRTLQNFIAKHGETAGLIEYEKYWSKAAMHHSKIANKFFSLLDKHFSEYTTYYAGKNKEYGINMSNRYIFIDYFILELNIAVEFYGNIYHANPFIYSENDIMPITNRKAKDIWISDDERKTELFQKRGIKTITIWEHEFKCKDDFDFQALKNKIINESNIC